MKRKESPIRKPLHALPGESLREQLDEMLMRKFFTPLLVALILVVLASVEWWRWYAETPVSPLGLSICAVLFTSYAAVRIWRTLPEMRRIRMAMKGETAVGQFLEKELLPFQGRVFHDVLMRDGQKILGNIDHVVVCTKGILTVETKTWSKSSQDRIVVDSNGIHVNGTRKPGRDPIAQAAGNARWLSALLQELTGRKFPVRPVVLFPGWFVEDRRIKAERTATNPWILSARAIPSFLQQERNWLNTQQLAMAAGQLSRELRRQRERPS